MALYPTLVRQLDVNDIYRKALLKIANGWDRQAALIARRAIYEATNLPTKTDETREPAP